MLAISLRGMMAHSGSPTQSMNTSAAYLILIVMEIALVYLVWRGIRAAHVTTLRELIGGRWQSPRDVLRDIALAFGLWLVLIGIVLLWRQVVGVQEMPTTVAAMLPHSPLERAIWILLSVAAGGAEEIVFRGYCQRQFEALTGNQWVALGLQAILFGVSHGYQGIDAMLRIALLGLAFGVMAIWRRSLRPGIIAHAWTDIASGIFGSR